MNKAVAISANSIMIAAFLRYRIIYYELSTTRNLDKIFIQIGGFLMITLCSLY